MGRSLDQIADMHAPLSAAEETDMLRSGVDPHQKRLALWQHNLRYASLLAGEAWNRRTALQICTPEDLRSVAAVALWNATGTFDPARKVRFISYCKWPVSRDLNDFLVSCSTGFSTPRSAVRILKELQLTETAGTNRGLVSEGRLASAKGYRSSVSSIDLPTGYSNGGEDHTRHHLIASEADVVREVETPELGSYINDVLLEKLARFDKRLPQIMREYYGIGCDRHTYQQIADARGLTRQRVEQLVSRSLRRLRSIVATKKLTIKDLLA